MLVDVCALCGRSDRRIVTDHDHATGLIRGRLCDACNLRLGWFEKRAVRVISYLNAPQCGEYAAHERALAAAYMRTPRQRELERVRMSDPARREKKRVADRARRAARRVD